MVGRLSKGKDDSSMTNNFLKGSALGALAAALGLTALPASAAPAVDFDAPMTAIDVGTANDDAKLAQDRDQYQRSRGERGERRQVFRQQRSSAPDAAVAPPRAQRAQESLPRLGVGQRRVRAPHLRTAR